jgi:tetratricopeptide (TPR) repeat protein
MDKQRFANEGNGQVRRLTTAGKAVRPGGEHRRSFFTSGKSLLPLNLGQPTNQDSELDIANAAQISSEPRESRLVAKGRHLETKSMQIPGENNIKPFQQQVSVNQDLGIDYTPEYSAYPSGNHVVHERHQRSARTRKRLKLEIEAYLPETYLDDVYGDLLSGNHRRLYEPSWPSSLPPRNTSPPPHRPKSRREANTILQKTITPLLDWYSLPESKTHTPEAVQRQSKIAKALDKHERERGARECRQKIRGSGSDTLYRNLPDAGLEANILMLINRAHLALQSGLSERAERHIDRALGLVHKLDYLPLNAKCWYWKGLVADKRGGAKEAAEAFFNALECVGKYVEGDYLPKYIQVYEQEILDMLQIKDEVGRVEIARKLERAAKGVEPLHLPSPKPAQYEGTGLDLTPPRTPSVSVGETNGTGERVLDGGRDNLPSLEETVGPEFHGLNIHVPLPSPSDLAYVRRRSTTSTPVSPHPTSPLKPLPAPRSYLPQTTIASTYDALSSSSENTIDICTFREDIDKDPERDASIAQRALQYITRPIIEAKARKDHDRNPKISSRPGGSMQASVLARRPSKQRPSSVSGVPQGSNTNPREFAEMFHPAIQEILLSPVNENSHSLSDSSAESSRPTLSPHSPAQLRPASYHESPAQSRPTASPSSPSQSRATSSHKPLTQKSRPLSRVLGVVGDIEWHEMVQKQTIERADKIQAKKEKYPDKPMKVIERYVQLLELNELHKKFRNSIPNPHLDHWESARRNTPSPNAKTDNTIKEEGKTG